MPGSSPLARGLQDEARSLRVGGRIIPARAGFTLATTWAATGSSDHPRSRGVYPVPAQAAAARRWIIPARAGFTSRPRGRRRRPGDHPRSRGVYRAERIEDDEAFGSSPLARGLRDHADVADAALGIIPARAGFTRGLRTDVAGRWDHPRSRGVYGPTGRRRPSGPGSSPLARGLQPGVLLEQAEGGIIPARAGFTRTRSWTPGPSADHPRSRGVYTRSCTGPRAPGGSSPLARGLLS